MKVKEILNVIFVEKPSLHQEIWRDTLIWFMKEIEISEGSHQYCIHEVQKDHQEFLYQPRIFQVLCYPLPFIHTFSISDLTYIQALLRRNTRNWKEGQGYTTLLGKITIIVRWHLTRNIWGSLYMSFRPFQMLLNLKLYRSISGSAILRTLGIICNLRYDDWCTILDNTSITNSKLKCF